MGFEGNKNPDRIAERLLLPLTYTGMQNGQGVGPFAAEQVQNRKVREERVAFGENLIIRFRDKMRIGAHQAGFG